jgi:hypothetical protein
MMMKSDCDAMQQQLQCQQQKEDPPEGGKYARRAKARRRDQHLPKMYAMQPSIFMMATQVSAHVGGGGRNHHCVVVICPVWGVIIVGSGDNDNHPGIVLCATTPQTMTTMKSWLGRW